MNLDASVRRLVETMDNVFEFVHEAAKLDLSGSSSQKDILTCMAKQTTECAYFIRDYAKNKNFCMSSFAVISQGHNLFTGLRIATNLARDIDSKIKEYEEKFSKLLSLFQDRAVLQTNITVLRVLDTIKDLSG